MASFPKTSRPPTPVPAAASKLSFTPLQTSPQADPKYFTEFGRQVHGFDPATKTDAQMDEIIEALYKYDVLLFRGIKLTPKQQFEMTLAFDPTASSYGHGNNKTGKEVKSILHPDLKTIPHQPEVQLIGNGKVPGNHEGLESPQLKHPHHRTFHKDPIPVEEETAAGPTRFYRWHIDAALYKLSPPKVTTLYAVKVPKGEWQTLRYDDGTGDELRLPKGSTAFVSGRNMLSVLPPALRSMAVRTKVHYPPHPYVWMSQAHALPNALGLESENLELPLTDLPAWEEEHLKVLTACWKNPVTGKLHLQVHPCAASALTVAPLPPDAERAGALFPDGATITDLEEARGWLYKLQRPGIDPALVFAADWEDDDLVLFHNRGLLHSVTGAFREDEVRMFHQCNLAASSDPEGPSEADVAEFA